MVNVTLTATSNSLRNVTMGVCTVEGRAERERVRHPAKSQLPETHLRLTAVMESGKTQFVCRGV